MGIGIRIVLLIHVSLGIGNTIGDCDSPLGLENGDIANSAITASSEYNVNHGPTNVRLNHVASGGKVGSWVALYRDAAQWIQIDLGKITKVTKIATQGRQERGQWVTKFKVSFSLDGGIFEYQKHPPYDVDREYIANKDSNSVVMNSFDPPIFARYIRVHPTEFYSYVSMRMELYGCTSGFPTPTPPACRAALGIQSRGIPDSSVTASSIASAAYKPGNGRLYLHPSSGVYGAWAAGANNENQWFQVDFGGWTKVAGLSTQGRQDSAQWVTRYRVSYSYDGVFFSDYVEDGPNPKVLEGNSDKDTVVTHLFKNPIITRFIRILPVSWNSHISLRAEFYGCKSGFEIPKVVCASPLGMENGKIPAAAIVASSRYNQYWGPERSRLNEVKEGSYGGGWAANYNDANQYLQIDLGKVTKVTRVATQGRQDAGWWVKSYTLAYSDDGGIFKEYNDGQVLLGNDNYVDAVGRILNPPIIARFVQIRVKTTQGHPAMRVELYGCTDGFTAPQPPKCMEALGMQNSEIPDSAITASSSVNPTSYAPSVGRLHFLSAGSGKYGSWAAKANDENQWFQVDMGSWTKISAVATQGRQDSAQWVKTYSLSFSYDGVFYETVNDGNGAKKIFIGNSDRYTVVRNVLDKPIITRYIRIHPETWQAHISMRTEFYGCKEGFDPPKIVCADALGIENGQIPDSALTSTSSYNQYWEADRSRLNEQTSGSYGGGWASKHADQGQWLQIDLGKVTKVTRIATQGRDNADWLVTSYTLSFSNGGPFQPYKNGEVIKGNMDRNTAEGRILDQPMIARFVRIHPKTWRGHIAMRVELFGCKEGFDAGSPEKCKAILGMQTNQIPDSALKASTSYNANSMSPSEGRLHFQSKSGKYGAWAVSTNDAFQWFQVDFGEWTQITRVATQGRQDGAWWVKTYSLSFSYDGVFFQDYNEDGEKKVFAGNTDQHTVVGHDLKNPIITRFIRINPITWNGYISLRAEFYGCRDGFEPPKVVCASPLGMENGKIPTNAIVASSRYNQYWGPERSRLNEVKEGSYGGGWAAQYNDANQYLQIDLGKVTKVTRVATQGREDANWWVKSYTLAYSEDGGIFKEYNNGQVLQGNADRINAVGRILDPPILARYVQIRIKVSQGYPAMRVELYGCTDGFSAPNPPPCMEALGMQTSKIPDSAVTASSSANPTSYAPSIGRLHFLSAGSGKYGSWAAGANNENQWFQVDMGSWTKISAVATQGRQDSAQWVKTYSLAFSYDGVFYETVNDGNGTKKIFIGNSDRFTVVRNVLDKPIITRYIRIHPETWNGHISMRTEFYGCKEGFDPPKIECADALGIENGQIPDSALTSSSSYNQYWEADRGRLNEQTSGSYGGGWASKHADQGQWLQIDLGKITKVTRIATQGRDNADWMVTSYTLSYSDGGPFKLYKNGEVIKGNLLDRNTAEGRILDQPIIGRFVRIHPKTWKGHIAMRVELFGCKEGFDAGKSEECKAILGMQTNQIPDSALSASTSYNANSMSPSEGRLHFQSKSGKYGAWAVSKNDAFQWFQADLGGWTQVMRVATQGRQDGAWWVKTYSLSFSYDGVFYEDYREEAKGAKKVFAGNTDQHTVVGHDLKNPIITRFIRINPITWNGYISLRAEFYGCREGFEPPKIVCATPLGVENSQIPDSAMSASTEYNQYYGASRGRLREVTEGSYAGGWASKTADQGQWLQIDFGKNTKVTRIATQGRDNANWWVTSYKLLYKIEGGHFEYYNNGQLFMGNMDRNTPEGRIIEPPIVARYIRVHPVTWQGHIDLRLELFGCREGFTTPKPPTCAAALGMETNQIPDSALSASTSYNVNSMGPRNGRLHFQSKSGQYGAWAVSKNDEFQWFQVDFGGWVQVTKVATQGRQDGAWWVKSYGLSFSYDGVFFEDYKEDGFKKVFVGNSDRFMVVTNTVKNPIITRYLRINPQTWQSYISLRAEFYGCRQGFEAPQIICRSALGIENGKIPDSAIVASTRYNQYWGPDRARLRTVTEGSYGGGWASQYADTKQFLQVDLGNVTKVTAIATQGRQDANWWVTSYTLAYSVDGGNFTTYGEGDGQVFQGNGDRNTAEGRIIEPPIIARFVQVRMKSWSSHISMRLELFGCTKGFSGPKFPACLEALGMQTGNIVDSAITASSEYSASSYSASDGRLHRLHHGGSYGCWLAKKNDEFQWLQINLGDWTKIRRVAIQGRQDADQWVKSFSLSYGYDGVFFKDYKEGDSKKVFQGSTDRYTVVSHDLQKPIITRYIRIHPETWQGHIGMRAELYGCRNGFTPPVIECASPLGMKSGEIPDGAITSSTVYNQYCGSDRSRLDQMTEGSYCGGWLAKTNNVGQWIQIDLGKITKITRIATQGRQGVNQWVTSYAITYSIEGGPFLLYSDNKILSGNKDRDMIVGHILSPAITARYIRIHPKTWYGHIVMRIELFGCREGFKLPDVPPCQIQLGMQNGEIPNSAVSASSQLNANYAPQNARLYFQGESGRIAAWIPAKNDYQQWLQIDFGIETQVTGVATQGRADANQFVKTYTLRYSTDGSYFRQYQPEGVTKMFTGNDDQYNVITHILEKPIKARYVRIHPESWNGYIAMRVELYGCTTNDGGYSAWSDWTQCSVTCGDGRHTRSRSCTNPAPTAGGKNCSDLGPESESGDCNDGGCPVNGGYSAWEPYGECTKACGGGEQTRLRTCTNPPPASGGKSCDALGDSSETRPCNEGPCGVDGGYGEWEEWGACSVTCAGGQRARARKCNNPAPQFGGKDCSELGEATQTESCNNNACPVDGGYGDWGAWSECSATCGKKPGKLTRDRLCNNPQPANGGKDCSGLGEDSETKSCKPKQKKCPVDGGYGKWSKWNKCTKTCGGGEQKRVRKCNKPKPKSGGKKCSALGPKAETQKCNTQSCGPEWKPDGCFKNVDYALPELVLNVARLPSIAKRYTACVDKANSEGVTLIGLDDKMCWTGDKYDKFGASGECKEKKGLNSGLSASETVFVYEKDGAGKWQPVGCYKNKSPPALPSNFDSDVKSVSGNTAIFEYCKAKAETFGYKAFGVDDKNCWSGEDPTNTYSQNGKSTKCVVNSKTGQGSGKEANGDMFVYELS